MIALSQGPHVGPFNIVSTIGNRVRDVVLRDFDSVPFLIRSELNCRSGSGAGTLALLALLRSLPSAAHDVPCEVLGSGLRVSSVKELAGMWGRDRGTIGRHLHAAGYYVRELVQLSVASQVAMELRTTDAPAARITALAGYTRLSKMEPLLHRVFGIGTLAIRENPGSADPIIWLDGMLDQAEKIRMVRRGFPGT
ncbi:MAG: hypothetical protein ACREN6_10940 [Gemmatimonadaceae bacterium]